MTTIVKPAGATVVSQNRTVVVQSTGCMSMQQATQDYVPPQTNNLSL